MYGEHNWFADLLPAGKNLGNSNRHFNRNYREGRKAIERLVKKHGEDVLLEIPKRWPEFKKDLAA